MNIYYTFMQNILYIIHARVVCRGGLLLLVVAGSGPAPGKNRPAGYKGVADFWAGCPRDNVPVRKRP